jgi:hypothetical protein
VGYDRLDTQRLGFSARDLEREVEPHCVRFVAVRVGLFRDPP